MRPPDSRATTFAAAAVRLWTRLYTSGLPVAVRNARRAEIESDLWESVHDPEGGDGLQRPVHILLRLVPGVLDDLRWRLAHDRMARTAVRASAALTATLFIVIAWWVLDLMRTRVLPLPPDPPAVGVPRTAFDRIDRPIQDVTSRGVWIDGASPTGRR